MELQLKKLIEALEKLEKTFESKELSEDSFTENYGWDHTSLHPSHILSFIKNSIHKLKSYGDAELPQNIQNTINKHINSIDALNSIIDVNLNDGDETLRWMIPNLLLTLNTIVSEFDYELFSFENVQDKKLIPKALSARLRGMNKSLDYLDESSKNLEEKVKVINDAHEAAESLPTDLASLHEAKAELDSLIKNAQTELTNSKKDITFLKEEAIKFKNTAEKATEEISNLQKKSEASYKETINLVSQCDDALQITTTQGLSAGFDQRANELKNSIWVWIVGLLLALASGAYIGTERIDAFTQVLNAQLTVGQAILHSVMSIFSIGGPLWLAWISTQQINQRFKLSEDYSYKATVTKSFTGFKKFAERFDQVTEERLFNSTLDRLDEMPLRLIEGKDYNSPWHEFTDSDAFKMAISTIPTLAKEAGKFANKTSLKVKASKHKNNIKDENKAQEEEIM